MDSIAFRPFVARFTRALEVNEAAQRAAAQAQAELDVAQAEMFTALGSWLAMPPTPTPEET